MMLTSFLNRILMKLKVMIKQGLFFYRLPTLWSVSLFVIFCRTLANIVNNIPEYFKEQLLNQEEFYLTGESTTISMFYNRFLISKSTAKDRISNFLRFVSKNCRTMLQYQLVPCDKCCLCNYIYFISFYICFFLLSFKRITSLSHIIKKTIHQIFERNLIKQSILQIDPSESMHLVCSAIMSYF